MDPLQEAQNILDKIKEGQEEPPKEFFDNPVEFMRKMREQHMKEMQERINNKTAEKEFGPGKYYIGDPCYIAPEFFDRLTGDVLISTCAIFDTTIGDWTVVVDGVKYNVDSGTFGLVHESLWEQETKEGSIIDVKDKLYFKYHGGKFTYTFEDKEIIVDFKTVRES